MEIVFLITSVVLTILFIWFIGRSVFDTNKQLLNAYKNSEFLGTLHSILGILMIAIFLAS